MSCAPIGNQWRNLIFKPLSGAACCLLAACANIVAPAGGPKDQQPPRVVQASPQHLSTRFSESKAIIVFDEYIKLDNPAREVVISPAIEPPPRIRVKGKKLEIDFKDSHLDSNTTYTVNFGESLRDVNESNVLSGFQYVFSTGIDIDSLTVKGKVTAAKDGTPAAKTLVLLHRDLSDSVLLKKKPFYLSRTAADGTFQFSHVGHGDYRLFALNDQNFNFLYDLPNEEVAFRDSVLRLDNNASGLMLWLFGQQREIPLKRTGLDDGKNGFIRLMYSKGIDVIEIHSASDGLPLAMPEYNKSRDTIIAWYIRAVNDQRLRLTVNRDSTEEVAVRNVPAHADSLKMMFSQIYIARKDSLIAPEGWIAAMLSHPAMAAAPARLVVQQDSPRAEIKPVQLQWESGTRHIIIDFRRKPLTNYSIIFPAGMFTDYFGNQNDTLFWRVKTKSAADFGSLKITITGQENRHYIMQLFDERKGSLFSEQVFTGNAAMVFDNIQPGSYAIRVISDSNANGRWDTGNFFQRLQPEVTYAHPERIHVRANWEMETVLKVE